MNKALQIFMVGVIFLGLMTVMQLTKNNVWSNVMGILAILFCLYGIIITYKGVNKLDNLKFMEKHGTSFDKAIKDLGLLPNSF